jgi:HAMP domain-containing protein
VVSYPARGWCPAKRLHRLVQCSLGRQGRGHCSRAPGYEPGVRLRAVQRRHRRAAGLAEPGDAGRLGVVGHDGLCRGRAVTRPLGCASLEVRLAATALCLLAAGAAVLIGVCGLAARGYLQGQADRQLRASAGQLLSRPFAASPLYGVAVGAPGAAGPGDGLGIEVRGPGGQVVMRAGFAGPLGPVIPAVPAAAAARAGQPATVAAGGGGSSWRVITEPIHFRARRIPFSFSPQGFYVVITSTARQGQPGTLVIGMDQRGAGQGLGRLAITGLAISGVVILAATCLAAVASRAIMRPLTQAAQVLTALAADPLPRSVPQPPGGEAARLAASLTTMLSQLEHAFGTQAAAEAAARASRAQMGRSLTDTGQQLRKPLSILHGIAGSYRRGGQPSANDLDRMMRQLASEAARIDALLQQLPLTPSDPPPPQHRGQHAPRPPACRPDANPPREPPP